jgi:hypothetical protein
MQQQIVNLLAYTHTGSNPVSPIGLVPMNLRCSYQLILSVTRIMMMQRIRPHHCFILGLIATAIATQPGCLQVQPKPKLALLYNRAAQYHGPMRNPVIVIPGILGSKLVDRQSERIVWGAFGGDSVNPKSDRGSRLMALPMALDRSFNELHDSVEPRGALDRVRINLLGLPISGGDRLRRRSLLLLPI